MLCATRPAPCWASSPYLYSHLGNLLCKELPLYSLIPVSIFPPKHQHLALIYDKPSFKVWLITCVQMLSQTRFRGGQSQCFSAVGHTQVKEQHPGRILLPGTKTGTQMSTQKACSGSWKSTQKTEFQRDQLPKPSHSRHISTNMSVSHGDVPAQLDLQQHL